MLYKFKTTMHQGLVILTLLSAQYNCYKKDSDLLSEFIHLSMTQFFWSSWGIWVSYRSRKLQSIAGRIRPDSVFPQSIYVDLDMPFA